VSLGYRPGRHSAPPNEEMSWYLFAPTKPYANPMLLGSKPCCQTMLPNPNHAAKPCCQTMLPNRVLLISSNSL